MTRRLRIGVAGAGVIAAATIAAGSFPDASPASARSCSSRSLRVRVATDRHSYRRGQRVRFTVQVRNESRASCALPRGSCLPQVVVTDSAGSVVWNRAQTQVVCSVRVSRRLAFRGAVAQTVTWDGKQCAGRDPRLCPGRPVAPGRYTATANWGTGAFGTAHFTVGR